MRRHISIYLGEHTTATHCADCQHMSGTGRCKATGESPAADDRGYMRTAACIKAEPPASRQVTTCTCTCGSQLRQGVEYTVHDDRCPDHGTKRRLRLV